MINEVNITVNAGKSVIASLILTFFFGPFGMLYSTVLGAIAMLVLYVFIGIITLGYGLAVLHPITMIWGAIAVSNYNRRLYSRSR
ncbi:MAG: hypothetical protein JW864_04660 [Spirochaetes bacterium]|nr:hypothetical protein [Spirochaetota bacterium]